MALWGGRFEKGVDAFTQEFGASLEVDKNMAQQDIRGSRAHARMLAEQGIISEDDQRAIEGLRPGLRLPHQLSAPLRALPDRSQLVKRNRPEHPARKNSRIHEFTSRWEQTTSSLHARP